MKHSLKVEPYSEAEERLTELFEHSNGGQIVCKLGSVFGVGYNEYLFDDITFNNVRKFLLTEEGKS